MNYKNSQNSNSINENIDLIKNVSVTLKNTERLLNNLDEMINSSINDNDIKREVSNLINLLKVEFYSKIENISKLIEEE